MACNGKGRATSSSTLQARKGMMIDLLGTIFWLANGIAIGWALCELKYTFRDKNHD